MVLVKCAPLWPRSRPSLRANWNTPFACVTTAKTWHYVWYFGGSQSFAVFEKKMNKCQLLKEGPHKSLRWRKKKWFATCSRPFFGSYHWSRHVTWGHLQHGERRFNGECRFTAKTVLICHNSFSLLWHTTPATSSAGKSVAQRVFGRRCEIGISNLYPDARAVDLFFQGSICMLVFFLHVEFWNHTMERRMQPKPCFGNKLQNVGCMGRAYSRDKKAEDAGGIWRS